MSHSLFNERKQVGLFDKLSSLARGFKDPDMYLFLAEQVGDVLISYSGSDLIHDLSVDQNVYVLHRFVTALDAASLDAIFRKLYSEVVLFSMLDLFFLKNAEGKTLLDCYKETEGKDEQLMETLKILINYSYLDKEHVTRCSDPAYLESCCDVADVKKFSDAEYIKKYYEMHENFRKLEKEMEQELKLKDSKDSYPGFSKTPDFSHVPTPPDMELDFSEAELLLDPDPIRELSRSPTHVFYLKTPNNKTPNDPCSEACEPPPKKLKIGS